MSKYKIAHIREQGIDLIVIPLDAEFGKKSDSEQREFISSIQVSANLAGVAGTVVPVWRDGTSHRFVAPPTWHSFFKSFEWHLIMGSVNKELTFG
jgi:hypothetical protein